MNHCFTYGSLMCEDIFTRVTGSVLSPVAATLAGYSRHPVVGTDYPGIRPAAGASLAGMLYRDVSALALARLDTFEGDEYVREALQVTLADGRTLTAWTYVFQPGEHHRLATGSWDFEHFLREGKARFLVRHPPAPL